MEFVDLVSKLVSSMPSESYKTSGLWFLFCVGVHAIASFATVELLPQVWRKVTFDVDFDNGVKEKGLAESWLRGDDGRTPIRDVKPVVEEGTLVEVNIAGKGIWRKGKIAGMNVSGLTLHDRHEWYNRVAAALHAGIMFIRTVAWWYVVHLAHQSNKSKIMNHDVDKFAAMTLDIMMGYLYYDFSVEVAKSNCQPTTVIHHVLGYVSLFAVRAAKSGMGSFYFHMVFLAEGSTPTLHVLWLLNKLKLGDWWAYKALAFLLLVSFLCLRVLLGPYTLWHMVENWKEWDGDPNKTWLWRLLFGVATVFVIINFYWFGLLCQMATKQKSKSPKGPSSEKAGDAKIQDNKAKSN